MTHTKEVIIDCSAAGGNLWKPAYFDDSVFRGMEIGSF